jgi:uncharacterized coiled-coil DUF342 family protein
MYEIIRDSRIEALPFVISPDKCTQKEFKDITPFVERADKARSKIVKTLAQIERAYLKLAKQCYSYDEKKAYADTIEHAIQVGQEVDEAIAREKQQLREDTQARKDAIEEKERGKKRKRKSHVVERVSRIREDREDIVESYGDYFKDVDAYKKRRFNGRGDDDHLPDVYGGVPPRNDVPRDDVDDVDDVPHDDVDDVPRDDVPDSDASTIPVSNPISGILAQATNFVTSRWGSASRG